jgi:hypothetical protein
MPSQILTAPGHLRNRRLIAAAAVIMQICLGAAYGIVGVISIPSPILIARVRETTGTYSYAVHVIAIVMLISILLPLLAKRRGGPEETRHSGGSPAMRPA